MEQKGQKHIAELKEFVRKHFSNVKIVEEDYSKTWALIEIDCHYSDYRIIISEILMQEKRRYAYYVLKEDKVFVGFDNAPDPIVIKLKYPENYKEHRYALVPHTHGIEKDTVSLTDKEMDYREFYNWLKENLWKVFERK